MNITIYNHNPKSIIKLLKKIEALHPKHSMTPITLSFDFLDVIEPDENGEFEICSYDYFENKDKHAKIDLDDADLNLKFDDIKLGKKHIIVNDKLYKYRKYDCQKIKIANRKNFY